MLNNKKKIVLTGGHAATTAVALVEEIVERKINWELFWIGPKGAIEGKSFLTSAARVLPRYNVRYYPIIAGRLTKKWTRWNFLSLFKIPIGFVHAFYLLIKIQPSIIVSFGGYAAFPVVVVGWLLRIPVVIHAQTSVLGLANRLSSFFATKIAISRPESTSILPSQKTILIGNPVMKSIVGVGQKKKMGEIATIYITGGSTGAQRVNRVVDQILETLLSRYQVIHQTGELDYKYFSDRREKLPPKLRNHYKVYSFIDPTQVAKMFEKADILVSRAGANTISEIMITKRPAVLIPIPWSYFNEQTENALSAQKTGIAVMLPESELNPENLLQKIYYILANREKMVGSMDERHRKLDLSASKKLVDLLEEILQ